MIKKKKSQFINSEKPARACSLKNWVTQPIAINLHLSVFSENSRVVFLPISVEERAVPSLVSAFAMCVAVKDPRMNRCLAQMKDTEKKPQNSLSSLYWKHQVYGRTSWTRTFSFKSVLFLVGLLWVCPDNSPPSFNQQCFPKQTHWGWILLSTATLAQASISVSLTPALQLYFLLMLKRLGCIQFLVSSRGAGWLHFDHLSFCPSDICRQCSWASKWIHHVLDVYEDCCSCKTILIICPAPLLPQQSQFCCLNFSRRHYLNLFYGSLCSLLDLLKIRERCTSCLQADFKGRLRPKCM